MTLRAKHAASIRHGFKHADADWQAIRKHLHDDAFSNDRIFRQTVLYRARTMNRVAEKAYFRKITRLKEESNYNFYNARAHAATYGL